MPAQVGKYEPKRTAYLVGCGDEFITCPGQAVQGHDHWPGSVVVQVTEAELAVDNLNLFSTPFVHGTTVLTAGWVQPSVSKRSVPSILPGSAFPNEPHPTHSHNAASSVTDPVRVA